MELRRLFTAGLWLVTTVAATALVWTATSVVARDVTDRPAPVVAHRDVVIALAAGSSVTPATTVPATVPASTTTIASARAGSIKLPTTQATNPPAPPTTRSNPAAFAPLVVPPPTATPVPPPRSETTVARPTPPTTQATSPTATYSTTGGVVTVACTGPSAIRLVSASPSDGFRVDSNVNPGPVQVEVHFVGDGLVSVRAACFFGVPYRVDEQGHRTGD